MENRNILNRGTLEKGIAITLVILLAVWLRLLPHAPNIAPVTGLALFAGYYMRKRFAYTIPLIVMFLSDLVLGFHSTMIYVYGSFLLIALLGKSMKQRNAGTLLGMSLTSSMLFFAITNFGVWAANSMYSKDLNGLLQSYIMGLPFLRNTFIGDLFYTFAFFYGYSIFVLSVRTFLLKFSQRKSIV